MIPHGSLTIGIVCLVIALAISGVMTPWVRRWAVRRDFVDHPGGSDSYKKHQKAIPYGGGIAITGAILLPMVAILAVAVVSRQIWNGGQWGMITAWLPVWPHWLGGIVQKMPIALAVIAGALVMHLMGIVDDHYPLSPWFKLIVQVVVALMLSVGCKIRVMDALGAFPATVLSVLWIVGLTNAFNFMDNMDGLSAGVAVLTGAILGLASLMAGQVFVPCMLFLLVGAVLGFLIYNFPPASIFMGDAGSLVVGYLLAVCAILVTFYNPELRQTPFGVLVPLVVFAVPLYDIASVIFRRYRTGVSIFRPDRRHFSHRLVDLGMSPKAAVLTIYLATAATALPALLLPQLRWPGALLVLGQCICVVILIAILESRDAPR